MTAFYQVAKQCRRFLCINIENTLIKKRIKMISLPVVLFSYVLLLYFHEPGLHTEPSFHLVEHAISLLFAYNVPTRLETIICSEEKFSFLRFNNCYKKIKIITWIIVFPFWMIHISIQH
jgi:hypothetical protein